MAIVGCNRHGKLVVRDGALIPSTYHCASVPGLEPSRRESAKQSKSLASSVPSKTGSSSGETTPKRLPTPRELNYSTTPQSQPLNTDDQPTQWSRKREHGALKLEYLSVTTKEGLVQHNKVPRLAAPRSRRAPDLSAHATACLTALSEALRDHCSNSFADTLRACAICRSSWTALRLAEWIVTSSSPDTS